MYGAKKGHMGSIEEQEEIVTIASYLAEFFPEGWRSAIYRARFMGGYAVENVEVEEENGVIARISLPHEFVRMSAGLRAGMYKENEGTWFSWQLSLWSTGKYKSEFNYENLPSFVFDPDPSQYAREARTFPRSENATPDWLRKKIDESGRGPSQSSDPD